MIVEHSISLNMDPEELASVPNARACQLFVDEISAALGKVSGPAERDQLKMGPSAIAAVRAELPHLPPTDVLRSYIQTVEAQAGSAAWLENIEAMTVKQMVSIAWYFERLHPKTLAFYLPRICAQLFTGSPGDAAIFVCVTFHPMHQLKTVPLGGVRLRLALCRLVDYLATRPEVAPDTRGRVQEYRFKLCFDTWDQAKNHPEMTLKELTLSLMRESGTIPKKWASGI